MPELPEVQTTVNGLNQTVVGSHIIDAWSDYDSSYFKGADNIKDRTYFANFKKKIIGKKIISATRRAKNILIHLESATKEGETILIHMKMTGHLLFGKYNFVGKDNKKYTKNSPKWLPISPESLKDPFNRHIHFILTLKNGKRKNFKKRKDDTMDDEAVSHLALCDSRKFAKVTLIEPETGGKTDVQQNFYLTSSHLMDIGPEPLEKSFTFEKFMARLDLKPHWKIKQTLMDQSVIAGIGNIYADESLWRAEIHPAEKVGNIKPAKMHKLFDAIKQTLSRGIDFGGDSMSDYRNIHGERGKFQEQHHAYQKTGERCDRVDRNGKNNCNGTIVRIVVGTRGTHYCNTHQKLLVIQKSI